MTLTIRNHTFEWGKKTYVMGILNVTPDSFSDGGEFNNLDSAMAQTTQMLNNGVDIIDVGGQSTRPGAEEVVLATELERVIPVIQQIRQISSIPISIDTTRAAVAQAAIAAGADLINDISGATFDRQMLPTASKLGVAIILMHLRGTPQTMQTMTEYQDLVPEIAQFFTRQIDKAIACGIERSKIVIDPGIGFAKTASQSVELLRRLEEFKSLNMPILVGVSRKSFMKPILNKNDPKDRVWGTAAANTAAIANGADIVRVHDVAEMYDVCRVADAIWRH